MKFGVPKSVAGATILGAGLIICALEFVSILDATVFMRAIQQQPHRQLGLDVDSNSKNNQQYLYYFSHNGFSNQMIGLARAMQLAYTTNRILILPPLLSHHARVPGEGCKRYEMDRVLRYAKQDVETCMNSPNSHIRFSEIVDIEKLSEATGVQVIDICDFVESEPTFAAHYFVENKQVSPSRIDLDGACTLKRTRSYSEMVDFFNSTFSDKAVAIIPSVFISKNRNDQSKAFLESVLRFAPSNKLLKLLQVISNRLPPKYIGVHERIGDYRTFRCFTATGRKSALLQMIQQESLAMAKEKNEADSTPSVFFASSSQGAVTCYKQFLGDAGFQTFSLSDVIVQGDISQELLSDIKVPESIVYLVLDQMIVSLGERVVMRSEFFSTFQMIIRVRHSDLHPEIMPRQLGPRFEPKFGRDFYYNL